MSKEPQADYQAGPGEAQAVIVSAVEPVPPQHDNNAAVAIKSGEWEEGLCGCCSSFVPNCCMVTFCPCVSLAQIAARIGVADYLTVLLIALIAISFSGGLVILVLTWYLRAQIRERFKIPGSCLGDCCTSFWCTCCAVAQMATHVKSYTPGSCSFEAPDILPAYHDSHA